MPEPIRLLTLTHNFPRYRGDFAGVFISLLARRLLEHDIRPTILAPHDAEAREREEMDGVQVYRFPYAADPTNETLAYRGNMQQLVFGSVAGPVRFRRLLRRFQEAALDIILEQDIQVVAGHWLIPTGVVMKRLAPAAPLPMLLSSHGTDIRLLLGRARLVYPYFRRFCRSLKRWTVVSTWLRDSLLRIDPSLKSVLEVLPLPHDESVFYRDDSFARDGNLVVSVTRFTEQKRVEYLVGAFAGVAAGHDSARLELYGAGPLQQQIEHLIGELGLRERVTLLPPVSQPQLREVYNRAALVVLNSYQEGFGLALSEAMLCGAAVIGTASGGITDIIKDNERGLLVPPDDTEALSRAIRTLLTDDARRQSLAAAGHRFALEQYASGPLAARYADIVRSALES